MKNEIKVTGLENSRRTPQWVINMAREYAEEHGLETVSLDEFYSSQEYQSQVDKNQKSEYRVHKADVDANS